MTRAEATAVHTALALAWLWHARDHRALALETGVRGDHLVKPMDGTWRVDAIGATVKQVRRPGGIYEELCAVDVVEVKGTRADLKRENLEAGKWTSMTTDFTCWLLVSADCRDADLASLPERWGVLRANDAATGVTVVRKADDRRRPLSTREAFALACTSVSGSLPDMHSVPGQRRPTQADRIAAASLALFRNKVM